MSRDDKGKFLPGNPYRFNDMPPERRIQIAKLGYQAFVNKHFNGDRQAARQWLIDKGLWSQDRYMHIPVYPDPGPLPF